MIHPNLIELSIRSSFIEIERKGKIVNDWVGKRLLVTAGPTVEALDPARNITNRSSGQMGVLLAQAARLRGAEVDLVHGQLQVPVFWPMPSIMFLLLRCDGRVSRQKVSRDK